METATFVCSICGESSRNICIYCTKDACANHLCDRCHRCSDCCTCEMPVFTPQLETHAHDGLVHQAAFSPEEVSD